MRRLVCAYHPGIAGPVLVLLMMPGAGCRQGRPASEPVVLARIYGIASLEVGPNRIVITKADEGPAGGLLLLMGADPWQEGTVRLGERFVLTDGQQLAEEYQLLSLRDDVAILKLSKTFDAGAPGGDVRRSEELIAVPAYDSDEERAAADG